MRILLTGATGYVGRNLLSLLQKMGHEIVCLSRQPRISEENITWIQGSLDDLPFLRRTMAGIDMAYYLVHAMEEKGDFTKRDRQYATNFAQAAKERGVHRIIYLGGLGSDNHVLSKHLKSRHEVGEILRSSKIETVEFRASIIIGKGSFSFELLKRLVDRLPFMLLPKWVHVPTQPISITDIVRYLTLALYLPVGESLILEIGGKDVITYGQLMEKYAHLAHLKRKMIPVPFLTPCLSGLWIALVTPYHFRVGMKLVQSLRCATVAHDIKARLLFPFEPMGIDEALQKALDLQG
ncbi:MAG: NAD(P)H-binding protein [Verrucomicrobia bacterium]|nr:NAD(P)H-binding protein [Verrucomicrobiota bacterium]